MAALCSGFCPDNSNNATTVKVHDDRFIIVNMSVLENIEALFRFTYRSDHAAIFRQRKEWFEKMPEMHMALWYVPATQRSTVDEAVNKLNHLCRHGDTPLAFAFKNKFTVEDATAFVRK